MLRKVNAHCLWVVVGLTTLCGGCEADGIPACADVSWVPAPGDVDWGRLTGPPSISVFRALSGHQFFALVPIDENTVHVQISTARIGGDIGDVSSASGETRGRETVQLRSELVELPEGVYFADAILLNREGPGTASYRTDDPAVPYTLSIAADPESSRKCSTEILAPTFTVESEVECEVPDDCETLQARRIAVEAEWTALLEQQRYSDLVDPGRCSARLALSELDNCDLDPCSEICRLHRDPFSTEEDCAESCEQLKSELGIDLRDILEAAAFTPGVFTCDICSTETFSFCAEMWGCMHGHLL